MSELSAEQEYELRLRELEVREAEQKTLAEDVRLRREDARRTRRFSPLVLAIGAAAIAAAANVWVAWNNGNQQRTIEETRAENARVLEMIKIGSPDAAATNLQFLLDTGLVRAPDTVTSLQQYLGSRQKGEGAFLAASGATECISLEDLIGEPTESVPKAGVEPDRPLIFCKDLDDIFGLLRQAEQKVQ